MTVKFDDKFAAASPSSGSGAAPTLRNRLAVTGSSTFDYGSTLTGVGVNETGNGPLTWAQALMGSPFDIVADVAQLGVNSDAVLAQIAGLTAGAQDGIVLHVGGNDLCEGTLTGAQALEKFDAGLSTSWSKGAQYVAGVIPHADSVADGGTAGIAAEIEAFRAGILSRSASDSRIYVVDHYSAVMDAALASKSIISSMAGSGSHANNLGAKAFGLAWKATFDGKVIPRALGAAVTLDPVMVDAGAWTVSGTGTISAKGSGRGHQIYAGAADASFVQNVAKAQLLASDWYVLVMDCVMDASGNFCGMYLRNNASTWQASMDRVNGGGVSATTANNAGTSKRMISRRFQIPQSVIDAATDFVFGMYLSTSGSRATVTRCGLFKVAP